MDFSPLNNMNIAIYVLIIPVVVIILAKLFMNFRKKVDEKAAAKSDSSASSPSASAGSTSDSPQS